MKWIKYLFSSIWRFWFLTSFIIVFVLLIPLLFIFTAIIKNTLIVNYIMKYWSSGFLLLSGVIWKVEYEEKLDPNKKYIFCPNHVSSLDIPIISVAIKLPVIFMGKKELTKIPIFGYFYKHNSVIVDRSKIRDGYSAFIKAGESIDNGINICIFPEGGIPNKKVFLKKFKNGAFKLALQKNIEIVPITLGDNKMRFPQEYYKGSPGIVRIKVHKPINIKEENEKTIENLNLLTYNTIFDQLKLYENN